MVLVRWVEWYAQTRLFDQQWLREVEESTALALAEIEAGQAEVMGLNELRQLEDEYRQSWGRYRLPGHWHWMAAR
jgi:hypothetical protein